MLSLGKMSYGKITWIGFPASPQDAVLVSLFWLSSSCRRDADLFPLQMIKPIYVYVQLFIFHVLCVLFVIFPA